MKTIVCSQCNAEWQLRSSMAHVSFQRHEAEVHKVREVA